MSLILTIRKITRSCAVVAVLLAAVSCDRKAQTAAPTAASPATPAPAAPERPAPPEPAAAKLSPEHAKIVARSELFYEFASYLKPEGEEKIPPASLFPVFGFRVKHDKEKTPPSRLPWAAHAPDDKDAAPTFYVMKDKDKIGNETLTRTSYIWFYRKDAEKNAADSAPAPLPYTAISLTVDRQGTTIIARVMQSASNIDRYFVTESLEAAARKEHGPPLADRRFSIERAISPAAGTTTGSSVHDTLVPKLMSAVPEPAGPWVYVDGEDGFVTAVLCRCTASQFGAFTEKVVYDIKPASDIPASIKVPDLSAPSSAGLRLPSVVP